MTDPPPSMTTALPRCQMFCDDLLDDEADPPTDGFKNMCTACTVKLHHLCHEVLPAIRRDGFYAPPAATTDEQLAAMVAQADARPRLREALRFVDDIPTVGGGRLADMWTDPRWPDDRSTS